MENEYGVCFYSYLTNSLIMRVHSHSNLILFNTNGSLPRPAVGLGKIGCFRRIRGKLKEIGTILSKILFCLFSPSKQWFREHGSGGNEKCENGGIKGKTFSPEKRLKFSKGNFGHCHCQCGS